MNLKKVSILLVGVLSFCLIANVVSALSGSYHLTSVGQSDQASGFENVTSFPSVRINNSTPNADAQLAISLDQKTLLGSKFAGRRHIWIKGKTGFTLGYTELEANKKYRPAVVFNASNDNVAISGSYILTQGITG